MNIRCAFAGIGILTSGKYDKIWREFMSPQMKVRLPWKMELSAQLLITNAFVTYFKFSVDSRRALVKSLSGIILGTFTVYVESFCIVRPFS